MRWVSQLQCCICRPNRWQASSHRFGGTSTKWLIITNPNVGASLLAKSACQSTLMLYDTPPSRAGSLPQF
ncbi:hypothetical protein FE275_11655 [Pseudomonas koreensis]|nr:hypothetical protein FE275_11655 [Pseudomonas koreensis]